MIHSDRLTNVQRILCNYSRLLHADKVTNLLNMPKLALKAKAREFEGIYKLSLLISIILFAYVLVFLYKLEHTGCECARDWRRSFITFYCVYTISLSIAQFINTNSFISLLVSPISFALSIMFIIFTLQYVHRLKREKCSCSDEMARAVLYMVAAIDAAIFSLVGLVIISNALLFMISGRQGRE